MLSILESFIEKLTYALADHTTEYFLYVGFTILALNYIKKSSYILATVAFGTGFLWIAYYESIFFYLLGLGSDSLQELTNFNTTEAIFFLGTFTEVLEPKIGRKLFTLATLFFVAGIIIHALLVKLIKNSQFSTIVQTLTAILLIFTSPVLAGIELLNKVKTQTQAEENLTSKFKNPLPKILTEKRDIKLLIYIGESTSSLNMSIYGYPRNTTPHLSRLSKEQKNLLIFKNVVSTHTTTNQSLLEALSIPASRGEDLSPINQRTRISVVDILEASGYKTTLFANQLVSGTSKKTNALIFGQESVPSSTSIAYNPNAKRPYDHEFFQDAMKSAAFSENDIIFMHSYAGHGPYLKFVPDTFKRKVDDIFSSDEGRNLTKNNLVLIDYIESYDSAVRYIDFSLNVQFEKIQDNPEPIILLYFSDHGESVYTMRAHDPSRFTHEMIRIPFIIYFNDKAILEHPELYKKYHFLSKTEHLATLAQLPATLLDILGIRILSDNVLDTVIGEKVTTFPPIVVRDMGKEITYIDINTPFLDPTSLKPARRVNDEATDIFAKLHGNNPSDLENCSALGKSLIFQFRHLNSKSCNF